MTQPYSRKVDDFCKKLQTNQKIETPLCDLSTNTNLQNCKFMCEYVNRTHVLTMNSEPSLVDILYDPAYDRKSTSWIKTSKLGKEFCERRIAFTKSSGNPRYDAAHDVAIKGIMCGDLGNYFQNSSSGDYTGLYYIHVRSVINKIGASWYFPQLERIPG